MMPPKSAATSLGSRTAYLLRQSVCRQQVLPPLLRRPLEVCSQQCPVDVFLVRLDHRVGFEAKPPKDGFVVIAGLGAGHPHSLPRFRTRPASGEPFDRHGRSSSACRADGLSVTRISNDPALSSPRITPPLQRGPASRKTCGAFCFALRSAWRGFFQRLVCANVSGRSSGRSPPLKRAIRRELGAERDAPSAGALVADRSRCARSSRTLDIYIAPLINPDGRDYSLSDPLPVRQNWRKNRRSFGPPDRLYVRGRRPERGRRRQPQLPCGLADGGLL